MREVGVDRDPLKDKAEELARQGNSVSWVADLTGRPALLGAMAFGDTPRPEAAEAIANLRARGIRTVMLTGDNRRCAPRCCRRTRRMPFLCSAGNSGSRWSATA